jgi:membrane fusion protein (multidrug efflux system)
MRFLLFLFQASAFIMMLSCEDVQPLADEDNTVNSRDSIGQRATEVSTQRIDDGQFTYRVEATGKLQSLSDYTIVAEAGGLLEYFTLKTGSTVRAGQIIAKFGTETIQLRMERAKLQVFNAQKEYESQLLGYEKLLQGMSDAEKADIKEKLRISTGLAPALQDIKEAEYEMAKSVIKAPFSGIAANVAVRMGEQVKPGTELCRLYSPNQIVMAAKVLETDLDLIQDNLTATIFPLGATKPVSAKLNSINPLVDENGMVTVHLLLQGGGQRLFVGMNARAEISAPATRALTVPRDALVYRGGKAVVFTYVEGLAKWNYVTTRRDNGREVEITEGLKAGDEVIVSNNIQLAHDAPVKKLQAEGKGGQP